MPALSSFRVHCNTGAPRGRKGGTIDGRTPARFVALALSLSRTVRVLAGRPWKYESDDFVGTGREGGREGEFKYYRYDLGSGEGGSGGRSFAKLRPP